MQVNGSTDTSTMRSITHHLQECYGSTPQVWHLYTNLTCYFHIPCYVHEANIPFSC
jgi:hypothetical protein